MRFSLLPLAIAKDVARAPSDSPSAGRIWPCCSSRILQRSQDPIPASIVYGWGLRQEYTFFEKGGAPRTPADSVRPWRWLRRDGEGGRQYNLSVCLEIIRYALDVQQRCLVDGLPR